MDTHCHGARRTNKEGSLSCKPEAKLQQELQEQRAVRGCVRHLQVPGEVLPHCLQPVIPHRCCSAVRCALLMSQVSRTAPELPQTQAVLPLLLQHLLSSWAAWIQEVTSGEKNAPFLPRTTGGGIFQHTRHPRQAQGGDTRHLQGQSRGGAQEPAQPPTVGRLVQGFPLLPARDLHMDYSPCKDSGSNVKSVTQVINK